MMDHTPVPADQSLPAPSAPSSVPLVMDGAVYLPAGHQIPAESEEFDSLLRRHLPPDIAADVMGQWRGTSRHATRLQWIISMVCLLAAFGMLYFYFPNTRLEDLKEHAGMEIRDLSDPLRLNSPYLAVYKKAHGEYSRGNNHAVCRILENSVYEIIRNGNRKADKVLVLYFLAARNVSDGFRGSGKAAALLKKLISQDPDNPNWMQFSFDLDPRICSVLDYDAVRRQIISPGGRSFCQLYLRNADYALRRLVRLKQVTNRAKYSESELKRLRETFDLFEVKLLISRWLLEGYSTGKSTLPDNQDDPGVFEREKALRIALKHQSSSCRDFWQARLFIAEILCEHDGLLNNIYWNGAYRNTKAPLEQEIKECRERLNGGKTL